MNFTITKNAARGLFVTVFFITYQTCWAQTPSFTDTEELHRRIQQEEEQRQARDRMPDVFLQNDIKPQDEIILPDETPNFLIHTLQLEGTQVERFPWAQEFLDQFADRRIGKEGINLIIKQLTNAFIARGYTTTRITIPEQDLTSGVFRFVLVPGVIKDVRFTGNVKGNWQTAFPIHIGDILNVRDLEQGLEQLKRLSSQDAEMQIVPGDKLGESMIAIQLKRNRPSNITVTWDNAGSRETGKNQVSLLYSLDNPLQMNDNLNLSINHDADIRNSLHGTRGNSFAYSLPYGYWTFTVSGSNYNYYQTIQTVDHNFVYKGKSDNFDLLIQRLIHRDQSSKTNIQFKITKKHSYNYVDDTEIAVQRKNVTIAEIGVSQRRYIGQAILNMDISQQRGVSWFGAQPETETANPLTPTTRYSVWAMDTSLTVPVKFNHIQARYTANLRAQYIRNTRLYASEFFSIGGRYTVRGFDGEQTLAAENGWLIRNELVFPIYDQHEVYLAVDHGEVSGPSSATLVGRRLTGMAVGGRGTYQGLRYEIFAGMPLSKPDGFVTPPTTFGFQLIRSI